MTKAGSRIVQGAREALAYARGEADVSLFGVHHIPTEIDVRAIRKKLGLTQQSFASRYSFSVARVRDWEQGRSRPDGALRAYLLVIAQEPEAVERALRAA